MAARGATHPSNKAGTQAKRYVAPTTLPVPVTCEAGDDVINVSCAITAALVDNPEDVSVTEVEGEQTTVLELRVRSEDLGKVIGKGGQTAQAMRVLLTAVSAHTDQRIGLEIVE